MADRDGGSYSYVYHQSGQRSEDVEARAQAVHPDARVETYQSEADWDRRGTGESDVKPLTFPVTSVIPES